MLAIDRAANNTSVVFTLEWRGWRLLFPGDAELASWRLMDRSRRLRPIHVLKVAHHGSRNGTPSDDLLDKILPTPSPDSRRRFAVVSSWPETYPGVPDPLTIQRLDRRVDEIVSTRSVPAGKPVMIELEG
jgi:beta-lactamase superfamily II metal-dependent hydrolase